MLTGNNLRHYNKVLNRHNAEISAQKNQKPVSSIVINIVWKRSRMWGANPHAEACVHFKDGSYQSVHGFTASGCGYDKESTVIAEIFNRFLAYKLYGKVKKLEKTYNNETGIYSPRLPYGISIRKYKASEDIHDKPIPAMCFRSFEGAIGTNCYYDISKAIGGIFEHISNGKTFDVYKYTDKRKK